jgi:hypothetical protein
MQYYARDVCGAPSPTSDLSQEPFLGVPSSVVLENATLTQKLKSGLIRVKILFSTPTLTRLTILAWIIYGFDYWGFSIAGKQRSAF